MRVMHVVVVLFTERTAEVKLRGFLKCQEIGFCIAV